MGSEAGNPKKGQGGDADDPTLGPSIEVVATEEYVDDEELYGEAPDDADGAEDDGDGEDDDDGAHSTVRPEFDLERYAQASEVRERAATLLDEVETEHARLASVLMDSNPPSRRGARLSAPGAMPLADDVGALRLRLSPLTRVPTLTKKPAELGKQLEDPQAAYVLGFVDGLLPLETIVDVAGLPEVETLRVLDRFIAQGVIAFRTPPK